MSYDPQSGGETQPTGGGEPQPAGDQPMGDQSMGGEPMAGDQSTGGGEPMGGQPTQPTGDYTTPPGGYAPPPPPPPPPAGGYAPPPPPSGDYTQPQGGYAPPPQQGGYAPPPQGGYAPPPQQGGYTPPPGAGYPPPPPPPPGAGYGAYGAPPPPPPPGTMGTAAGAGVTVGGMGTVNQATLQDLFQSYVNAVTKPNVATYEAEIPKASWLRTGVGLIAVDIVAFIFALIAAAIGSAAANAFLNQLSSQGNYNFSQYANFTGGYGAAFGGLIWTPILFFIGAGLLWLMARMFGGTNSNFMTHAYLLSISYTPLRIVGAVLNVIPVLGLLSFLLFLYQLYSAGLAMQASQRMQPGRAQLAAFLPLIIGIVLFVLCICLAVVGLVAVFNNATTR